MSSAGAANRDAIALDQIRAPGTNDIQTGSDPVHLSVDAVQHWLDDDEDVSSDDYEGVTCEACAGVHFVNRKGKVLGRDEEN